MIIPKGLIDASIIGSFESVKVLAKFNPDGTLDSSSGVTSITSIGVGEATVNFSEDFSDANYVTVTGVFGAGSRSYWTSIHSQTASGVRLYTSRGDPTTFEVFDAITAVACFKV